MTQDWPVSVILVVNHPVELAKATFPLFLARRAVSVLEVCGQWVYLCACTYVYM